MKNEVQFLKEKAGNLVGCAADEYIGKFETYIELLRQWNRRTNLISKNDEKRIVERHILESIGVMELFKFPVGCSCLDLGSGAGFPGIPIKIIRPDLNITLLDSKRMKCLFLKKAVELLKLESVEVLCERVELISRRNERGFDFIFSRGVSDLNQLWMWSEALLKKNGKLLAWKGGNIDAESGCLKNKKANVCIDVRLLPENFVSRSLNRKIVTVHRDSETAYIPLNPPSKGDF